MKVLNNDGTFSGTAVSGFVGASSWAATENKTIYAQCSPNSYTITVKAGAGISSLALSGWTGTGTGTLTTTQTLNAGSLETEYIIRIISHNGDSFGTEDYALWIRQKSTE